jgi:hypothetical protein
MATGSFARSIQPSIASFSSSPASTPVPQYTRTRKRGRPVSGIGTESEGSQKRPKPLADENDAIERLLTLIGSKETALAPVLLDTFELATKVLQDEYESRLSESHFLQAIELFQSQSNASIFRTLQGRLRDRWLCKNAGVELLDVDYRRINNELDI